MTDLKDIMTSGKAPNDDANATTADANKMEAYFAALFTTVSDATVHGLVINTTAAGAMGSAELIPYDEIAPEPKPEMKFYYHLQVSSPLMGPQDWHVASWLNAVKHNGIEAATRTYMAKVTTQFTYLSFDPSYKGIVDALTKFYADCK